MNNSIEEQIRLSFDGYVAVFFIPQTFQIAILNCDFSRWLLFKLDKSGLFRILRLYLAAVLGKELLLVLDIIASNM